MDKDDGAIRRLFLLGDEQEMTQEFVQRVKDLATDVVNGIHTVIPGKIVSFDLSTGQAVVEPCMKYRKPDGTTIAYPNISGVPVMFPQSMNQKATIAYEKLVKAVDKLLKKLKIPCSIDEMKISRCDLTVNVEFSDQDELTEYLRIFKKSFVPAAYTHVFFKKNDGKVKDYKERGILDAKSRKINMRGTFTGITFLSEKFYNSRIPALSKF